MIKFDGPKLTDLRANLKITRSRLALKIMQQYPNQEPPTQQTIRNWEDGSNQPSLVNAFKLSRVFGVTIDDFVLDLK